MEFLSTQRNSTKIFLEGQTPQLLKDDGLKADQMVFETGHTEVHDESEYPRNGQCPHSFFEQRGCCAPQVCCLIQDLRMAHAHEHPQEGIERALW